MINLLSPIDKKELRAARRNAIWSRYTFLTIILLVAVNFILGITFFYIKNQAVAFQERIDTNESLSNQQYRSTKTKAENFRKDLATTKAILESETNFSTVITNIAGTIPPRCILGTLSLNGQSFNTAQSLNFNCKTADDILRLKTALEENEQTFEKVNIVSTTTAVSQETNPYPVAITMSLVLKKPLAATKVGL